MLQYYGYDTFVTRGDLSVSWEVVPVVTALQCFQTVGSVSVTNMFPDTTNYQYIGSSVVDGILCNQYQLQTMQGAKNATYTLAVNAADNLTPVQLNFLGRDLIVGSHTDSYVFVYKNVSFGNSSWPAGIFNEPAGFNCAPMDQSSASMMTTGATSLIRELIPQSPSEALPLHPTQDKAFVQFMETYGKSYGSEEEMRLRHARFTQNRRTIQLLNHKHAVNKKSLRLAVNHIADYTEEEVAKISGGKRKGLATKKDPIPAMGTIEAPADASSLPASIDWNALGAMEPVMDQGIW